MEFEGKMPSTSYINKVSGDMKVLSLLQMKEVVDEADVITLKHDGTTKKGYILSEVQLERESGTYTCGLREQVYGKADDTAEAIHDILKVSVQISAIDAHQQQKLPYNVYICGCLTKLT